MLQVDVQDRRLRQVLGQLQSVGENASQALKPIMAERMKRVMVAAKKLTPVAETNLRRSGQYRAQLVGQQVRGRVTFGNTSAAYAEVQHESEGFRHTLPAGVSRTKTTRLYRDGNGRLRPRKRKHTIKGYRGGRSHFLHGKSWSAWDDAQERLLQEELLEAAEMELHAALMQGMAD